jgi:phosphogluconate dehydratase
MLSSNTAVPMHPQVLAVTARIRARSVSTRSAYLAQVEAMAKRPPGAQRLGCANVAHAFAAMEPSD